LLALESCLPLRFPRWPQMSITRDPPAHQLGRGLSSPSGNSAMRCTPPLCTSLPCIDLPPSSVVGHALASALPCLSCALLCSAAHALLHPRAPICHTLGDSLCPRSNQAALHRLFPPSGSPPRASTRARATWAYSCPGRATRARQPRLQRPPRVFRPTSAHTVNFRAPSRAHSRHPLGAELLCLLWPLPCSTSTSPAPRTNPLASLAACVVAPPARSAPTRSAPAPSPSEPRAAPLHVRLLLDPLWLLCLRAHTPGAHLHATCLGLAQSQALTAWATRPRAAGLLQPLEPAPSEHLRRPAHRKPSRPPRAAAVRARLAPAAAALGPPACLLLGPPACAARGPRARPAPLLPEPRAWPSAGRRRRLCTCVSVPARLLSACACASYFLCRPCRTEWRRRERGSG
jgi:hypothetical protein